MTVNGREFGVYSNQYDAALVLLCLHRTDSLVWTLTADGLDVQAYRDGRLLASYSILPVEVAVAT